MYKPQCTNRWNIKEAIFFEGTNASIVSCRGRQTVGVSPIDAVSRDLFVFEIKICGYWYYFWGIHYIHAKNVFKILTPQRHLHP